MDAGAERLQHLLAMVAGQYVLADAACAMRVQGRQQQRRLHLGTGGGDMGDDSLGILRPMQFQRHQRLGALALIGDAEGFQRRHHPRHGARAQRCIAGEGGGDGCGGHGAHHQARAGARITEVQVCAGGLPVPHPGPLDAPAARTLCGQLGAEAAQGAGGGMNVAGLQKPGNAGFPVGQGAQDKRPLGNGFVPRHLGCPGEGASAAGGEWGGIGVMHQGLQMTFTAGANRGKRAPPTTPSSREDHLGQGRSWNQTGVPQLCGEVL